MAHRILIRLLPAAAILVQAATAATAQTGPVAILACADIPSDRERLLCFDREAKALKAEIGAGQVQILGKSQIEASERAAFGFPASRSALPPPAPIAAAAATSTVAAGTVAKTQSAAQASNSPSPSPPQDTGKSAADAPLQSISSKIVEVIPTSAGLFVLQLEDLSIWRTTEAERSFSPKLGQTVTISRASLGSYLMKTEKSRPVRAKRMR